MLKPIGKNASILKELTEWTDEVLLYNSSISGCGTLKSYSEGLLKWKHSFLHYLCELEKTVIKQGKYALKKTF